MQSKEGKVLFRLPLSLAIILAFVALLTRLLPIVVILVVVALFLKYEFRIIQR